MEIKTRKLMTNGTKMNCVIQIIDDRGNEVKSLGFMFSDININLGECLNDVDLQKKLQCIRECRKISGGLAKGFISPPIEIESFIV